MQPEGSQASGQSMQQMPAFVPAQHISSSLPSEAPATSLLQMGSARISGRLPDGWAESNVSGAAQCCLPVCPTSLPASLPARLLGCVPAF